MKNAWKASSNSVGNLKNARNVSPTGVERCLTAAFQMPPNVGQGK